MRGARIPTFLHDGAKVIHLRNGDQPQLYKIFFFFNFPGSFKIHQGQIGIISFPNKAPLFYLENSCGIVAHFLSDLFQPNASLVIKFQHRQEAVLNQRPSGRGLKIFVLLFFPGVGSMICGNYIDAIIQQRLENFLLISAVLIAGFHLINVPSLL